MLKKGCVPSLNLPERLFEHPKQARAANHWSILRNAGCVQEETSEMTVDHSAHPETVEEHAADNTTLIGTTDNDECNGTHSEYLDTQQQQTQTWGTYRRHQLFSVNFLTEKQTKHFTGFSVQ